MKNPTTPPTKTRTLRTPIELHKKSTVIVRITPQEKEAIASHTKQLGITTSDYLRSLLEGVLSQSESSSRSTAS
jgi:hypothetical protein